MSFWSFWGARNQIRIQGRRAGIPGAVNQALSVTHIILHGGLDAGMTCKSLDLVRHHSLFKPFGDTGGPQVMESGVEYFAFLKITRQFRLQLPSGHLATRSSSLPEAFSFIR